MSTGASVSPSRFAATIRRGSFTLPLRLAPVSTGGSGNRHVDIEGSGGGRVRDPSPSTAVSGTSKADPIREGRALQPSDLDAEQGGDGHPEVAEGVPGPDVVRATRQTRGKQWRPLSGMIGGWRGRVAPVVAGDQQDPPVERLYQFRESPVDRLDRRRVPPWVVAMAVLR